MKWQEFVEEAQRAVPPSWYELHNALATGPDQTWAVLSEFVLWKPDPAKAVSLLDQGQWGVGELRAEAMRYVVASQLRVKMGQLEDMRPK